MSFYTILNNYRNFNFTDYFRSVTPEKVEAVLAKHTITELDFLSLLSDTATDYLEQMAELSGAITRQRFGKVIVIFTPLYISNFCDNVCAYCSFARQHPIARRHLLFDEIKENALRINRSGIRHILMLTGESRGKVTLDYLAESVRILSNGFSSVGIEIYPLTNDEYLHLIEQGVDSLTLYQEVYDEASYRRFHSGGPKNNYLFRLEAPERACSQGIRSVTVGALMGLGDVRREAFFAGLHAHYLQMTYPQVELSVAFPRIRPHAGEFVPPYPVSNTLFVQILIATRIFLQSVGITISTRESKTFRNAILPLGVTRMSAGVSTAVGGHSSTPSTTQFEIADNRSVGEIKTELLAMGYQPVMQDWNSSYLSTIPS